MPAKRPISPTELWLLALAIVALDWLVFFAPLTGLAAAYLLLARPPWFREWVERLYDGQ